MSVRSGVARLPGWGSGRGGTALQVSASGWGLPPGRPCGVHSPALPWGKAGPGGLRPVEAAAESGLILPRPQPRVCRSPGPGSRGRVEWTQPDPSSHLRTSSDRGWGSANLAEAPCGLGQNAVGSAPSGGEDDGTDSSPPRRTFGAVLTLFSCPTWWAAGTRHRGARRRVTLAPRTGPRVSAHRASTCLVIQRAFPAPGWCFQNHCC